MEISLSTIRWVFILSAHIALFSYIVIMLIILHNSERAIRYRYNLYVRNMKKGVPISFEAFSYLYNFDYIKEHHAKDRRL